MPTYVQGTRGSENVNQDRRKFSVSDKLWMVNPEAAVLAFFARKLNKQKVTDPEYRWFEKEEPSRQDAVNNGAGYDDSATSVVVDNGTKFRGGDVVLNVRTGEQMKVSSVSTNTLTVVRGWGSTAGAAMLDNDVLVILGNANAEGASARTSLSTQATKKYNYTQIFREPFDVTGTEAATELYAGGSDIVELRKEHLNVHNKDIERSFLFGEPKEDTSGSQPIRATGGAKYFISTNVSSAVGTLTESTFEDWISDLFLNGGDKKMGFLSPLLASAVNSWAKGKLQMFPKDKTYGIAISRYLSIHGELDFVIERILGENSTWNGMAFAFEMDKVGYRYLGGNGQNRDTRLKKNIQAPGDDLERDEYLSEVGYWMALENRHGYMAGVTAYS